MANRKLTGPENVRRLVQVIRSDQPNSSPERAREWEAALRQLTSLAADWEADITRVSVAMELSDRIREIMASDRSIKAWITAQELYNQPTWKKELSDFLAVTAPLHKPTGRPRR